MDGATARRERQDAVLAELSELGLTLARELHARAMAAETPQESDKLALAFQRVSRGVRQTFALELKLQRARREAEREVSMGELEEAVRLAKAAEADARSQPEPSAEDLAARARRKRIAGRKDRVKGALNRLIWNEAEGDEEEYEILGDDLDYRLSEAARRSDFLDLPLEALIRQIKSDMGLSGQLTLTACEAPPPDPADRNAIYDAGPPNTG
jgi:hypothetical protein